ncbi:MAG TPA: response regulator [Oculatellaceae cyanobacterium]
MLNNSEVEILLVEDTFTQAMLMKHLLSSKNYKVTLARSADEALQRISEKRFTIILSDVNMPEIDGYELCRRIKRKDDTKNLLFVLLLSFLDANDLERLLTCGADNVVFKDYNDDFFISKIDSILRTADLRSRNKSGTVVEPGSFPAHALVANNETVLDIAPVAAFDMLLSCFETIIARNNAATEKLASTSD